MSYDIFPSLSDLLHSVWHFLGPFMLLQHGSMALFHSFWWLINIVLYTCTISSLCSKVMEAAGHYGEWEEKPSGISDGGMAWSVSRLAPSSQQGEGRLSAVAQAQMLVARSRTGAMEEMVRLSVCLERRPNRVCWLIPCAMGAKDRSPGGNEEFGLKLEMTINCRSGDWERKMEWPLTAGVGTGRGPWELVWMH